MTLREQRKTTAPVEVIREILLARLYGELFVAIHADNVLDTSLRLRDLHIIAVCDDRGGTDWMKCSVLRRRQERAAFVELEVVFDAKRLAKPYDALRLADLEMMYGENHVVKDVLLGLMQGKEEVFGRNRAM